MEVEARLFEFMQRYYNRKQLENEQDKKEMFSIYNEMFSQEEKTTCENCVPLILHKLKSKYEEIVNKI